MNIVNVSKRRKRIDGQRLNIVNVSKRRKIDGQRLNIVNASRGRKRTDG